MEQSAFTASSPPSTEHAGATGESTTTEQAQERARQLAGQAQEQAQQAGAQARDRIREQLDRRSTQAGERVNATASDLRTVAEQLRQQDKQQPADLAEQAAQRVQRLGDYLQGAAPDRMLHDVEAVGRRRPWALALGGMAVGLGVSRFLKASSSQRYRSSQAYGASQSYGSAQRYPEEHGPNRARGVEVVPQAPTAVNGESSIPPSGVGAGAGSASEL
jgi:hypothetical protein